MENIINGTHVQVSNDHQLPYNSTQGEPGDTRFAGQKGIVLSHSTMGGYLIQFENRELGSAWIEEDDVSPLQVDHSNHSPVDIFIEENGENVELRLWSERSGGEDILKHLQTPSSWKRVTIRIVESDGQTHEVAGFRVEESSGFPFVAIPYWDSIPQDNALED